MEEAFLKRYFGSDPRILSIAKLLCNSGNKAAAKELNRVISVLGKKPDAERIIQRVLEKYNIKPSTRQLANKVILTQDVSDAKEFVASIGGRIINEGTLFNKDYLRLFVDNLTITFVDGDHLTRWVVDQLAPRYK